MSLLPSESDTAQADDVEPRVVGVDSDDADELLSALSSATARRLLCELHENPAPPAELADCVDTTLQNVQYHLEKLEDAGAVTVVDTAYSEKGREMDVYAPADRPLVIFAGDDDTTSIRTLLTRLFGGFGALAFASAAVQYRFGDGFGGLFGGADGVAPTAETGGPTSGDAAPTRTPTPEAPPTDDGSASGTAADVATETAARTAEAAASGVDAVTLPPGLLFFLGGATVLLAGFAVWYFGQ